MPEEEVEDTAAPEFLEMGTIVGSVSLGLELVPQQTDAMVVIDARDTRYHDYDDDGKQRGGETYHKKGAEAKTAHGS